MLRIDRLRIGLPAGMEHRADRVARLVGDELAKSHPNRSLNMDSLSLGKIEMFAGASDQQIASRIASQITGAIHAQIGGKADA